MVLLLDLYVCIQVLVDCCSGVLGHVRLSHQHWRIFVRPLFDDEAVAQVNHVTEITLISLLVEVVGAAMKVAHLSVVAQLTQVLHALVARRIIDVDHLRITICNLSLAVLRNHRLCSIEG